MNGLVGGQRTKGVWWQHGVVYQAYARSFQDSDGGDVGDLRAGKVVISTIDANDAGSFDPTAGLKPDQEIVVLLD